MLTQLLTSCNRVSKARIRDGKTPHILEIVLLMILLSFLVSCATKSLNSTMDQSLITNKPCEAPCWYGLELGKSTTVDVRRILPTLPFIDQPSILEKVVNGSSDPDKLQFTFNCIGSTNSTCGVVETSENGIVNEIYLVIKYPLDIELMIEHLGTPQYYTYTGPLPQVGGCHVVLFWTTKDIKAGIMEDPGQSICAEFSQGEVNYGLQIDYVTYTDIDEEKIKSVAIPWTHKNP